MAPLVQGKRETDHLSAHPQERETLLQLAALLRSSERYGESEGIYKRLLLASPDSSEMLLALQFQLDDPIYHKDLRAVEFVTGEVTGKLGAPIYAIFELEDLQEASAFDIDDLASENSLVVMLLQEMRELYDSMQKGDYLFGRQDLPVMRLLKNASESDLPFLKLFYKINLTHTRGLDVPEE